MTVVETSFSSVCGGGGGGGERGGTGWCSFNPWLGAGILYALWPKN